MFLETQTYHEVAFTTLEEKLLEDPTLFRGFDPSLPIIIFENKFGFILIIFVYFNL